ncbi:MAG TPA: carboxypeptidase-like regulatory domain-containing protein [Candidatus Thermoplasmatota archaeon]|nr:carboxypeptidase-like regulatory domain-containing protein [Candidatus Thermoplasmatota archaeon]
MRTATTLLGLLAGLVLLASPAQAFCSWSQQKFPELGPGDAIRFYPEAATETSGPFLSLDAGAGAAHQFKASPETAGVTNGAAALQKQAIPGAEFLLSSGLPETVWLDVSKPIVGTIYWTSTSTATGYDPVHFRIELLVGATMAGGVQFYCSQTEPAGFARPAHFRFRPEVDVLPAGEPVKLRITKLAGVTDLILGTGNDHQTFLEVRYFTSDPLAGALYLEGRQLRTVDAPGPSDDAGGGFAPVGTLAVGALAGLAAVRGRSRRATLLVAALAFGAGLAGCLRPQEGLATAPAPLGTDQPQPTASVTYESNETLKEAGTGAITGIVRDGEKVGVGVEGAHVSLLGTSQFVATGKDGRFEFENLTAKTYVLRADKEGFLSLEDEIQVRAGEVANVEITLTRPASASQWRSAHLHNDYGDADSLELWNDRVLPLSYSGTPVAGTYWVQPFFSNFETKIPIDVTHKVPAGTKRVEVVLTWDAAPDAPREIGLRILTGPNQSIDQFFVPRRSGETFRIAMFPNEADLGHQVHTSWSFFISPLHMDSPSVYNRPAYVGTQVSYKITAFKGVVPYEPPHPKFWNGRDEIALVSNARLQTGAYGHHYPHNGYWWTPAKGSWVPPGTAEVRGYLRWEAQATAEPVTWRIAYKPANAPSDAAYAKSVTMGPAGAGSNNFTFSFAPLPSDVDQYYQPSTRWQFYPDDDFDADDDPRGIGLLTTSPHTSLWLTAVAVRDPTFVEE